MRNGVTLYTSLPPVLRRASQGREIGDVYQRKCLQSWRDAGFDIVSLNDEAEVAALRRNDLGVDVISGPKGRPRIVDLLRCIRARGGPIAGIINADVVFLKGPDVAAEIIAAAHGGLVMLERINIAPDTMAPTLVSCCGFDAFLFDTRDLATLDMDPELKIGDTWWDYCFPLTVHRNGGHLRRAPSPLLLHLDHPQGWDKHQYLANGRRSYETFGTLIEDGRPSSPSSAMTDAAIGDFAVATFAWLRAKAGVIDDTARGAAAA